MKHLLSLILVATALLVLGAASCSSEKATGTDRLLMAEEAVDAGRYPSAQRLADKMMSDSSSMSAGELCRLSLLFMRLSDAGTDPDANTAYAARALALAFDRNPDSTRAFIGESSVDVRAVMTLLSAINNAPHGIVIDGDTIYFTSDSIPEEEHYEH